MNLFQQNQKFEMRFSKSAFTCPVLFLKTKENDIWASARNRFDLTSILSFDRRRRIFIDLLSTYPRRTLPTWQEEDC